MILEELHERLEGLDLLSLTLRRDSIANWECQVDRRRDEFGVGTGRTIAEAIEGALDDMEMEPA